jgi:hypothetical protein
VKPEGLSSIMIRARREVTGYVPPLSAALITAA